MSPVTLICAPSVRNEIQQALFEQWRNSLGAQGFLVDALGREHYTIDPWGQLAKLMADVDGVVVLGFRQMDIRDGLWRRGTPEAAAVSTVWTSPWMHVEAGMAIASGKPVLVAPERGVAEGVFAAQNWTADVFGASAEHPWSLDVKRWAWVVRDRHSSRLPALNR
ncbi:hypothetical protein A5724_11865 [Mycobacterium sp. ACS1612]|uniref:hypothetical protein n=1 Tax=Mycobacterium sp. ACS1612 TaxID=1834117 RepID=UPI000800E55E|nr:hypothetical protein [Mycobacterium sp. ACS1612]OBF37248.1 hypothetical protein A5724_11865 [Mycobacterium sp. ACS1612]